jgi:putative FmdB family regulatory protein
MPIYEFYCAPCHTIYAFLSRRVDAATIPSCPRCAAKLSRQVSPFAHLKKKGDGGESGEDNLPQLDEERLEQIMAGMASEVEQLDDDDADPRAVARLMRQVAHKGGVAFNPAIEEALARMEKGEDPDALEAEYGDALNSENPFAPANEAGGKLRNLARRLGAGPRRDPKLYDMHHE